MKKKTFKIKSKIYTSTITLKAWEVYTIKKFPGTWAAINHHKYIASSLEAMMMGSYDAHVQCYGKWK